MVNDWGAHLPFLQANALGTWLKHLLRTVLKLCPYVAESVPLEDPLSVATMVLRQVPSMSDSLRKLVPLALQPKFGQVLRGMTLRPPTFLAMLREVLFLVKPTLLRTWMHPMVPLTNARCMTYTLERRIGWLLVCRTLFLRNERAEQY